ncbi:MAG: sulfopyruvate decarboxylase subunit beta [Thermodesulfovibrionales bacterium]
MRSAEEELIGILKEFRISVVSSLPCEKIKNLLSLLYKEFLHLPLTREEEGVGLSAGVALADGRPAMFVQSSGMGNMLNALLSLTSFYALPLPIFVSQRGIYKEAIAAQIPMGQRLPGILREAGISYSIINSRSDFHKIEKHLSEVFDYGKLHIFLLSPAIWDAGSDEALRAGSSEAGGYVRGYAGLRSSCPPTCDIPSPKYTRYEIIEMLSPYLDGKAVVCNLGFPSKELYNIKDQVSNFYMLGSMGMATPVGIGIAISTKKKVVVIDGDGSILMNPNSLAMAALLNPENLTIIAIDNGAYGSTGNQPTLTSSGLDLEYIARAFGIKNTAKVCDDRGIKDAFESLKGSRFIHILALPGNREVSNIPIHHLEIKKRFQEFLRQA